MVIKFTHSLDNPVPEVIATLPQNGKGRVWAKLCYHNNSLYVPDPALIYKVDLLNNSYVSRFAGTGNIGTPTDGPKESAIFANAVHCAFDSRGTMYIADYPSIRVLNGSGIVTTWPDLVFQSDLALLVDS